MRPPEKLSFSCPRARKKTKIVSIINPLALNPGATVGKGGSKAVFGRWLANGRSTCGATPGGYPMGFIAPKGVLSLGEKSEVMTGAIHHS